MGNGVGRTIKPSTNSKTKKSTGLNKKNKNKKIDLSWSEMY